MSGNRWDDSLVQPCGTNAAHRRHLRWNEPVDDACRIAHNRYVQKTRPSRAGKVRTEPSKQPKKR